MICGVGRLELRPSLPTKSPRTAACPLGASIAPTVRWRSWHPSHGAAAGIQSKDLGAAVSPGPGPGPHASLPAPRGLAGLCSHSSRRMGSWGSEHGGGGGGWRHARQAHGPLGVTPEKVSSAVFVHVMGAWVLGGVGVAHGRRPSLHRRWSQRRSQTGREGGGGPDPPREGVTGHSAVLVWPKGRHDDRKAS